MGGTWLRYLLFHVVATVLLVPTTAAQVAICIVGQARSLHLTAPSLLASLADPMEADIFLSLVSMGSQESDEYNKASKLVDEFKYIARFTAKRARVVYSNLKVVSRDTIQMFIRQASRSSSWQSSNSPRDQIELHNREECIAQVANRENQTMMIYNLFVITRADIAFFGRPAASVLALWANMTSQQEFARRKIAFIPGPGGGDFYGIQNAVGIYSRAAIPIFFHMRHAITNDLIPELVQNSRDVQDKIMPPEPDLIPGQFKPFGFWLPEPVLKLHLEQHGVDIQRIYVPFCRLSVKGGCRYPGEASTVIDEVVRSYSPRLGQKSNENVLLAKIAEICEVINEHDSSTSLNPTPGEENGLGMGKQCCGERSLRDLTFRDKHAIRRTRETQSNFGLAPLAHNNALRAWSNALFRNDMQCSQWMVELKGWFWCYDDDFVGGDGDHPFCCRLLTTCRNIKEFAAKDGNNASVFISTLAIEAERRIAYTFSDSRAPPWNTTYWEVPAIEEGYFSQGSHLHRVRRGKNKQTMEEEG